MTQRVGRRTFLAGSAAAAAAMATAGRFGGRVGASASSTPGTTPSAPTGSMPAGTPVTGAPTPKVGGEMKILNWQKYIDVTENGKKGTVDRFKEVSDVNVTYLEDYNDNNEVFNRELQPVLGTGKTVSYDIICPTYWMANRLKSLNWVETLPLDKIPNHANLDDRFLNLSWDQGATTHMPWQAGLTGMAYNPALTGRELTSINDLFDPAFKGKVAMLTEMRDSIGLVMLAMGLNPADGKIDEMRQAVKKIGDAAASGQIRQFTGNEYLRSLESGDFVACIAWSGDIVQLNYTRPDIKFVFPAEGAMSWFDTMMIPKGSTGHLDQAAAWMNFVYDPVQAAQITQYVQYVSPVKGVKDELIKLGGDAAKLAESQILFPNEETQKRLYVFGELSQDEDLALTDEFLKATGA